MKLLLPSLVLCTNLLAGCGSLTTTTTQNLTIEMFGVLEQPDDVSEDGNANPKYYEFVFKKATLLSGDGDVELVPTAEETFKIIDRPQIVFTQDIADYEGSTFTGATIEFDPTVAVGGKYETTEFELTNPILENDENFQVEKSKGLRLLIRIQWQNTLIRNSDTKSEEVTEPSFDFEIESA